MKTKQLLLAVLSLVMMIGIVGCESEYSSKAIEEIIIPCNMQSQIVEEINDMQTKLYFIVPDPTGMPIVLPEGLLYDVSTEKAYLKSNTQEYFYSICNFPYYITQWGLAPKVIPNEEDGIDIVLSGLIYSEASDIEYMFELTLLKKSRP